MDTRTPHENVTISFTGKFISIIFEKIAGFLVFNMFKTDIGEYLNPIFLNNEIFLYTSNVA